MKNIDKIQFDNSKAVLAAAYLRSFCDTTPCQKCPFYSAHDCTLRSSAPDAWTTEDWRSPEDIPPVDYRDGYMHLDDILKQDDECYIRFKGGKEA